MGQKSAPAIYPIRGGYGWKKESSIKHKEYPEGKGLRKKERNAVAINSWTCNQTLE